MDGEREVEFSEEIGWSNVDLTRKTRTLYDSHMETLWMTSSEE